LEKTVTVERFSRSSVVTFGTGSDVLRFIAGFLRAYERYGDSGAQMIVVESSADHHGYVQVAPLDKKNTKAMSAAAGK
jgi:hypothetical protein